LFITIILLLLTILAKPDDVERAKTKLKATLLMGLDGTVAVCEDIGKQVRQ
jgi:hypothetical protein